jgi:hypothetical protein
MQLCKKEAQLVQYWLPIHQLHLCSKNTCTKCPVHQCTFSQLAHPSTYIFSLMFKNYQFQLNMSKVERSMSEHVI